MASETFVLDLPSNPHPRMLEAAIRYRRLAHLSAGEPVVYRYWQGYLDAMCDATGLPPEQIDAWVAAHDDFDPSAMASAEDASVVPVHLRRK